jgi:hypothetical protein
MGESARAAGVRKRKRAPSGAWTRQAFATVTRSAAHWEEQETPPRSRAPAVKCALGGGRGGSKTPQVEALCTIERALLRVLRRDSEAWDDGSGSKHGCTGINTPVADAREQYEEHNLIIICSFVTFPAVR